MPAEFVADDARSEGQWEGKGDDEQTFRSRDTDDHSRNQEDFRSHKEAFLSDWVDLQCEQVKWTNDVSLKLNTWSK